jgi:iron complex outermembrane receptor protein
LLPTLEADLSGRFDHYSDFGDTFNPKIGLKWTPIPQVGFRGTYSTGFRAPSFSENGSSQSEGFATINPCGPTAGGAAFCAAHGNDAYAQPYGLGLLSTANPAIKPEKARNYTFGTILQPFTDIDLSGTVDYYNIKKTSVISPPSPGAAIGPAFGFGALPAGYTVTYAAPDPLHPGAPLAPTIIGAPYINASSEVTSGLDVNVHFSSDLWDSGIHWTSEAEFTQIFEFKFTPGASAPGVTLNYVGTEAPWELSSSGGTPRTKGSWANTLAWGDLSVTGTLYYTDGFREAITDATFSRNCFAAYYPSGLPVFCNMKKFYDFDLTARYHATDTIDVFGGIRNLFDAKAPLDVNNYATACGCYNPTYDEDGAVGRYFTIGVSFKD